MSRSLLPCLAALLFLGGGLGAADGLVLSEIMAINDNALPDEDGEYPDWIEITNAGETTVDIEGWSLSDDPEERGKWRFPAILLGPGARLLVFASGKDRTDPRADLHTNFELAGAGEFLGLYDSAGNPVSGFAPKYPPQLPDISFGYPQPRSSTELIRAGDTARAFVPTSSALEGTWAGSGFDDSGWLLGTTGVGYDIDPDYGGMIGLDLLTPMRGFNSSAYIRVPFTVTDTAGFDVLSLRLKYDDGFVAFLNGEEIARRNAPIGTVPRWNWAAIVEHGEPTLGSLAQDFDSAGTAYVLNSDAGSIPPVLRTGGPAGRYLELLADATGLTNTIGFQRTFGPATSIVIDFDYRMSTEAGYPGNERADGFGVALIETSYYGTSGPGPSTPGVVWERPVFPATFSVGFDIYNGQKTENSVSINWDGSQVASTLVTAFPLNAGVFHHVTVEIESDAGGSFVSVTMVPNALVQPGPPLRVFDRVAIRNMAPFDQRLAFGGRTGGESVGVDLDNIEVAYRYGPPEIAFETFDVSGKLSALRPQGNVLAIQGLNRTAGNSDFLIVPELEATDFGPFDTSSWYFFPEPTPGAPNLDGFPGVVIAPLLSHTSGVYTAPFSLTATTSVSGAVLRYTLDGAVPTEGSPLYSGPISISESRTVRVRAFKEGHVPSPIAEGSYLVTDASASGFGSNLPLVVVDTFRSGIGDLAYTTVAAAFIDTVGGRSAMTGVPSWVGSGAVQIRGSSSQGFPKKMYKFEIRDAYGDDLDVPLLGLPSESDWVLYGPYSDKALMRNHLSYAWSNEIGRYAPRTLFVEMFLNTDGGRISAGDYVGVYVLIEKIKRNADRVDIDELLPSEEAEPEVTGGYILKKDRLDPGDVGFSTSRGQTLAFVDPKEEEITPAQRAWIKDYFDRFEAALYGSAYRDPLEGYRKYIDVDSFVDHHILVEVTKNIDGFRLSTYMYKDRGRKLTMGPIWDYNLSLGNANYLQGWLPEGWYYPQLGDGDYPWYRRLFQDPDFEQRYIDRWTELRRAQFVTDRLIGRVDETAALLAESQVRNFNKWRILGSYVWPNWFIANTYQEELTWMKGWIAARVEWIDNLYAPAPIPSHPGGALPPAGVDFILEAPSGTVFYTLDGTDPRLSGGGVSPAAASFGEGAELPLILPAGPANVRFRVPPDSSIAQSWMLPDFNDSGWAGGAGGAGVGYENGTGYEAYFDWNVGSSMSGVNETIYIRYSFSLTDPQDVNALLLEVMYDDGYVAYLNGVRVAESNAPATPAWNSGATALHDDGQAVIFEPVPLDARIGLLRAGKNVLAVQGLNSGMSSSDFLFRPRLIAGRSVAAGEPIRIEEPTEILGRTYQTASWSGLFRTVFVRDVDVPLRVSEIMYRPPPDPSGTFGTDEFEFIELVNAGAAPIDLLGVRLSGGIDFDFSGSSPRTLGPGQCVVVVENLEAFASRYDVASIHVAGKYSGKLSNAGEAIRLEDGRGVAIQEFAFDDAWYPQTDGPGYSLHIVDPYAAVGTWNLAEAWGASAERGGSPGELDSPWVPGGAQVPGDYTQDGALDIADPIALLLYLFVGTLDPPPCGAEDSAGNRALLDASGDGVVDVTDAVHILEFLFQGGPPHALGEVCLPVRDCPDLCSP